MFVGVLYIPSEKRLESDLMERHMNAISEIFERSTIDDAILLFGDFNQSHLAWKAANPEYAFADPQQSLFTPASRIMLDGMAYCGLRQRNLIANHLGRCLDLVFTNDKTIKLENVRETVDMVVPLDRYHPAIELDIASDQWITLEEDTDFDTSQLNFRRADFDGLNEALRLADWSPLFTCGDLDQAVEIFGHTLRACFVQWVPAKQRPRKPPWSNARLKYLKKERARTLALFTCNRNPITKSAFNRASSMHRGYNRYRYKQYVTRTQSDLRRNPKRFWSFVNSKRKGSTLPTRMFLGGRTAANTAEKCELFANHFASVFDDRSPSAAEINMAIELLPMNAFDLDIFPINEDMVIDATKRIKSSFMPGPDGIPTCVLKKCITWLQAPLAMIFNLSMQQQRYPSAWKISNMMPVFKKGDKKDIRNYRGITSLCAGSKCFETVINKVVFARTKAYISAQQHGFFPSRSVDSNLVEFTSFSISQLDKKAQVDVVYTDIKAAFDTVNHEILLAKLARLGATERFCRWLKSFLTERRIQVKLGAESSDCFIPPSGVPQGSNFGPRIFSIHFNDASICLGNCKHLMYADDLKMYAAISDNQDCVELQESVTRLARWCEANFLSLNVPKCTVLTFCRRRSPIVHDYLIDGVVLERVDHMKDLGVLMDDQLTFKLHYSSILERANRQLGFMFKIADEFNDPTCLCALYCALVRSILEFASVVWAPYEEVWISRFEGVQKKFVRVALRNLPWQNPQHLTAYEHRCNLLGIDTLTRRRKINQATFGAKVLLGEIDCSALLERMQLYVPGRIVRSRQLLLQEQRSTLYGFNDPSSVISRRLQEAQEVFDFNFTAKTFNTRLCNSQLFRG